MGFESRGQRERRKISDLSHRLQFHRRADYDHYLISLLQPSPKAREAYVTLRAFNVELAQVRDVVTNPMIGRMRMQFWRDTVDESFRGQPRNAPIALALAEVVKRTPLSKLWFTRIIAEREANLDVDQYISIKDMEKYCENTSSALLYLHMDSLGVKNTLADHAASHLGKASGIATLLRGTPFQAKERRVYLPGEVLSKVRLAWRSNCSVAISMLTQLSLSYTARSLPGRPVPTRSRGNRTRGRCL